MRVKFEVLQKFIFEVFSLIATLSNQIQTECHCSETQISPKSIMFKFYCNISYELKRKCSFCFIHKLYGICQGYQKILNSMCRNLRYIFFFNKASLSIFLLGSIVYMVQWSRQCYINGYIDRNITVSRNGILTWKNTSND